MCKLVFFNKTGFTCYEIFNIGIRKNVETKGKRFKMRCRNKNSVFYETP